MHLWLVSYLPTIEEYPLRATHQEIMDKLNGIINALTSQVNIIQENREQWTKYVLDMQKGMKIKLDLIRNLEEDIHFQKNLLKKISKTDLSGIPINVPMVFELHKFANSTLESIEKMKSKEDPEILSEIQSKFYIFKNALLDFVTDLEMILPSKGNKGLEDLEAIIEERNNLTKMMAYTIREED